MEASKIRQKLALLLKERNFLEQELLNTRTRLIKGCLSKRYTECRKGNCKCTKGQPHGPFLYMSVKVKGRLKYYYVGKKEDIKIVEGLMRYKQFQSKLARIRKINKEINLLWCKLRKELVKKGTGTIQITAEILSNCN